MGEWLGQAVDANIVEIENARYFDTFSETTVGQVVEGKDISFRQSIQDESTHASFIHSFIMSPALSSSDSDERDPPS